MAQVSPRPTSCFQRVVRAWEAVQVELHGTYSLSRLHALRQYEKKTSLLRAIAITSATPIPVILLIVAVELLPLRAPNDGGAWSIGVLFRSLFMGFYMGVMTIKEICQNTPELSMSNQRACVIAAIATLGNMPFTYLLMETIGYPIPFSMQIATLPWLLLIAIGLALSWKDQLKQDASAKANFKKALDTNNALVCLITAYTAYNCVYLKFSDEGQVAAAFCLPLMKLFFKNWVSKSMFHLEDLAPLSIVITVDLFHALFVSLTMQKTTTHVAIIATMAVDFIQFVVASADVYIVMKRVHHHAQVGQKMERSIPDSTAGTLVLVEEKANHSMLPSVEYALRVLETNELVRGHPEIALPRHLRPNINNKDNKETAANQSPSSREKRSRIVPTTTPGPPASSVAGREPTRLTPLQEAQLESAKGVLKVLHMVECYILVEFVEVVVPAIYSVYLFAMVHLPNRVYNTLLCSLTSDELRATAVQVATFACLELASLLIFCLVMDRMLQSFSTTRLLAFVWTVDSYWTNIAALGVWVYYVVQIPLEHFGEDFTFQFVWLRKGN